MDENQGPLPLGAHVGPPAVWVTGASAGPQPDGSVLLTLYGIASVADFKSTVPVIAFTGLFPAKVAQDLLTNLDGALMAAAQPLKKEE